MQAHAAANLFPMLPDAELAALAADIKLNGLVMPIVTIDGHGEWLILDGRNRARACELAGVRPNTIVWSGKDPVAFVVSANLHRRHLDSSQRAMIAQSIANLDHGVNKRKESPKGDSSITQAEAAALMKVSKRSVERARQVKEKGVPELIAAVVAGDVPVTAAAVVAKLPAKEQRAIVAKGKTAVAARAKQERAKAPPSEARSKWDREDFLSEVRSQVEDWRNEWLKHEPSAAGLITDLRLYVNLLEKEHARNSASNG